MSDLISRKEAIDALHALQTYKLGVGDDLLLISQAEAQTELMMLLSSQSEPKTGKWLEKEVYPVSDCIDEVQSARCSECGKYHTTPYMYYFDEYKFCPSCGAKMEK